MKLWHIVGIIAGFALTATMAIGGYGKLVEEKQSVYQGIHTIPAPTQSYLYPNKTYTPGVIATSDFKELTAVKPCGTYSQCHRKTSELQKKEVCNEYPNNCSGMHEIDHFCPLALGCADEISNLWAEPEHVIVNGQDFGFHTKDKLESYLVNQMKVGKISPSDAQQCILNDWVACYGKYLYGKYGAVGDVTDVDNQ